MALWGESCCMSSWRRPPEVSATVGVMCKVTNQMRVDISTALEDQRLFFSLFVGQVSVIPPPEGLKGTECDDLWPDPFCPFWLQWSRWWSGQRWLSNARTVHPKRSDSLSSSQRFCSTRSGTAARVSCRQPCHYRTPSRHVLFHKSRLFRYGVFVWVPLMTEML